MLSDSQRPLRTAVGNLAILLGSPWLKAVHQYQPMIDHVFQCVANEVARLSIFQRDNVPLLGVKVRRHHRHFLH